MSTVAKHEIDLTNGPILKKLIIFALPLVVTNIIQLLFNAADIAVLGIMVDDNAVGAVTSTTALIDLLVKFFIGLSVGASVVLSMCVGKKDKEKAQQVVGTSTLTSLVIGVFLMAIGFFGAETFLTLMNVDPTIRTQAVTYLQIYFLGIPIILFYNFSSGLLRAVGDTVRPMIFLIVAGVANIGLNIFFIGVCNMTVEGVAIATVISQLLAAILTLIILLKNDGFCKLKLSKLKIYKQELVEIMKIGVPSGLKSTLFSISNVIISSTINSFGAIGTKASGIAFQFDGVVSTAGNAIACASMSFVSQNYGAKKIERIKSGLIKSVFLVFIISMLLGGIVIVFHRQLFGIMTDSEQVIELAWQRTVILCTTYFLCGIMDTVSYALSAMGKSFITMVLSIFFICIFRILWVNTIFLLNPKFYMVFISYPISWLLCIVANLLILIPTLKKLNKAVFD